MKKIIVLIILINLFVVACNNNEDQAIPTVAVAAEIGEGGDAGVGNEGVESTEGNAQPVVEADTAVPPTPTQSAPLAATVNGSPIFLADYEAELARYEKGQAELGIETPDPNYRQIVLDALIERMLIEQAAQEQGITVSPEMVDEQLNQLRTTAGEAGNFDAWLEANHWTEEEFRQEIASGMVIEQMVALITANVPSAVEQVRARMIQLNDATVASTVLTQARNGDDFAFLAQQHSLDNTTAQDGGDIGFFAQGSLLVPEIETAAFALTNPGDVSEVITVANADGTTTYYLVQLVERDPQRPLPANMQYLLYEEAFQNWVAGLWQNATVERLVQ